MGQLTVSPGIFSSSDRTSLVICAGIQKRWSYNVRPKGLILLALYTNSFALIQERRDLRRYCVVIDYNVACIIRMLRSAMKILWSAMARDFNKQHTYTNNGEHTRISENRM